jgi:hypothetical protein
MMVAVTILCKLECDQWSSPKIQSQQKKADTSKLETAGSRRENDLLCVAVWSILGPLTHVRGYVAAYLSWTREARSSCKVGTVKRCSRGELQTWVKGSGGVGGGGFALHVKFRSEAQSRDVVLKNR